MFNNSAIDQQNYSMCKNYIKVDRRVLEQENMGWNHLVQDRDRFWAAANTALINPVIIWPDRDFLITWAFTFLPPLMRQPPEDQGFLVIETSRSNLGTPHSVGLLWTSDQPAAEASTSQHATITTDIHAPGGIRTHNPSKRAAADPRLRPRGHWDWLGHY